MKSANDSSNLPKSTYSRFVEPYTAGKARIPSGGASSNKTSWLLIASRSSFSSNSSAIASGFAASSPSSAGNSSSRHSSSWTSLSTALLEPLLSLICSMSGKSTIASWCGVSMKRSSRLKASSIVICD